MAKAKKAPAPLPAFYHPEPENMEAAKFRLTPENLWVWFFDNPEPANRWHLYVSLLPKRGQVFVFHTKGVRNRVDPIVTSVQSKEQFIALIRRYGWTNRR